MATRIHQVPEWEAPSSTLPKKSIFSKPGALFSGPKTPQLVDKETGTIIEDGSIAPQKRSFSDRFIPHWCGCFGRSRKACLCSLAALFLLILVLGLGLGLGLSKKKNSEAKNLPLPSSGGIFNGDLTYYSPGPGYGACGYENTEKEAICAVSHILWDAESTSSNPNQNPLCGKMIRITRLDETKGRNNSVDVKIVDRCTGCKPTDIDLSITMFEILADEAQGRVVGTWAWLT